MRWSSGRAALAQGTQSLEGTLDVPESLSALTRERIRRLPDAARDAVAIAGLALQPTRSLVVAAWPDGPGTGAGMGAGSARDADIAGAALDTAIAAGIVEERADGRLAFTHPLLAWAAASTPTAERREAIHERLAVVAPDADERVRHLAIVTPFASETVAEALHAAALRAHDRGAPETATDLELDAVRLTPADLEDRGHQRTMTAAEYAIRAGDPPRARRILERHIERLPAGPPRARAITLLADIRSGDDWEAKLALLDQAREEAGDDHASRAEIEVAAGLGEWMLVRNLPRGVALDPRRARRRAAERRSAARGSRRRRPRVPRGTRRAARGGPRPGSNGRTRWRSGHRASGRCSRSTTTTPCCSTARTGPPRHASTTSPCSNGSTARTTPTPGRSCSSTSPSRS